jgi:Carbohydrate esterase, sialic acid-specific acetylesterase
VTTSGVMTKDIPITITEGIAEPLFTLQAPAAWDGRSTIEVVPLVTNLDAMKASGAGDLKAEWSAGPLAVTKEIMPGKLILKRAQNSGKLTVTATISNGGKPVTQSVEIAVTEPKSDAWVVRTPAKDEKPEDGQFYARADKGEGTLHYNGTLTEAADSVFLKVYADDKPYKLETAKLGADKSYALAVKLKPGLIKYRVEFGKNAGGKDTVLRTVSNIVCGDAYLIEGQSNALATDTREQSPPDTNEWIRSYGSPPTNASDEPGNLWCNPVWKAQNGEKAELGWWGMELAKRLLESQKVPIFIINAAVGGTRIDQHQRSVTDPTDLSTIYGRMLWRVQQAKLTHGIRSILWHQGESDQGSDGPTGGYGWEAYQPLFVEMSAAWKQDFPNVQHYYTFQIWPNSCSMAGKEGSGDRLREKQRTLPQLFSNMSLMSTLGVRPPGGCHFPLIGWAEFARTIQPLIERDNYGKVPAAAITPPNLRRAYFASKTRDTITLEFDQPVRWGDALAAQFYLDGEKDKVASGSVSGNVLTLKLKDASIAKTITYLKETDWSQDTLLEGANGIAALTFCEVPLLPPPTR